ncbi:hypothetical protein D3C86_902500 [compost metagenome]
MMLKSFYASVSSDKTIFNYEDENRKIKRQGKLEIKLNSRACHVNLDKPGYLFKIDAAKKNLNFRIAFVYEDAMHLRNYDVTPEVENDFVLGDQFNAIIIKTDDANAFVALAEHTGLKEFVKEKIKNAFVEALKMAKTGSELKFIYENIPDFILNQLLFLLKEEKLWDHVNLLTDYDDTGTFSNFKDGSGALMNLFKAFGNSYYIIEKFSEDQAFLKRIYENLDGSSEFMGQVTSNRIIFASMISACCIYNNKLKTIGKIFYYGKGYKIDSDISWFSDEKEDEFYLKQQKIVEHTYQQPNTETDEFGVTIPVGPDLERIYSETVDQDQGKMYHPLDMVSLVDYTSGIDIPIPVPIIFVKALAGEKEIQDVELAIRIGFDIVAIIAGVIVMATTANPGVFALALADVVLATGDVAINASRNEILETPGGAEFLNTWEQIYVVGGIITAGPALLQSFFKAGAGLLRTANAIKNFKIANFARACITKVILEINIANFTQNTVKEILYGEEALKFSGVNFKMAGVTRLQQEGVLFIKGIDAEGKAVAYAAIYRGEAIANGTAKEVRETFKEIWVAKGANLIEKLNEIFDLKYLPDEVLKHADEGAFSLPGNPKKSIAPGKMLGGGHGQTNIVKLESLGREYKIEHTYKNGVRIGSVAGHDSNFKRLVVGEKITGQSWFPKKWGVKKIKQAGQHVINKNFEKFKTLEDGKPIFDNFEGVRVGVLKTKGKPATIFPDNAMQPIAKSKNFELNPYKNN